MTKPSRSLSKIRMSPDTIHACRAEGESYAILRCPTIHAVDLLAALVRAATVSGPLHSLIEALPRPYQR